MSEPPPQPQPTPPTRPAVSKNNKLAIGLLMLALLLWGLYLAVGTAIFHREGDAVLFDGVRFGIVIAMSALFLGGWALLLLFRRPRPPRSDLPFEPPEHDPLEEESTN